MTPARRAGWALVEALRTPWPYALAAAFTIGIGMLQQVAQTLARAHSLERREARARAQLVADVAALASWPRPAAGGIEVAGVTANVAHDGTSLVVTTRDRAGHTHRFVAVQLAGAAPAAFAHAFAAGEVPAGSGAVALDAGDVPRLDDALPELALGAEACGLVQRDHGVALQHWEAGTDADDFVFRGRGPVDLAAVGDVLVVPGHLWIPPDATPLALVARRDCVVVVRGNLYLGRSVRVDGGGRVLFAVVPASGASMFADRDRNGRWSDGDRLCAGTSFAGPIEGGGSVWCGHGARGPLTCGAGLFAAGELHVETDTVIAGPVVVGHGVTRTSPDARLQPLGAWCFHPERERVPGFATSGAPRAGVLRCEPGPGDAMQQQTLYVAGLAR